MGVVAIVPAKMTSARLPGKNLRSLGGHPLIYYSIRIAQLVESIDSVYVSSESEEVLSTAERLGVNRILRPEDLSRPNVTNIEVLKYCYSVITPKPEIVILLQPTHPLRDPHDLAAGIGLLQQTNADSLFSVVRVDELRGTIENGFFQPEFPLPRKKSVEPKRFKNTGSFYLFRPEATFLTQFPFGKKILPYILSRPDLEIDIDSLADLRLAECFLKTYAKELSHFEVL